jgi:DNA ligase D-like protein (predicted 3'-phosphoesterase)
MDDRSERYATGPRAIRAVVSGTVQGVGFREATRRQAERLGAAGWVRNEADGTVAVHAEGPAQAIEHLVEFLGAGPPGAAVGSLEVSEAALEGHEQFAIRGVSAGRFLVQEHTGARRHFDLRLEVEGALRSWALPKAPSMDPAVKRLAIRIPDDEPPHAAGLEESSDSGAVVIWDRGTYEQGGRVAWPEAIERGHAVFVLHGRRLRGGFALQRTGTGTGTGAGADADERWLLIKRRDEQARPGSDA